MTESSSSEARQWGEDTEVGPDQEPPAAAVPEPEARWISSLQEDDAPRRSPDLFQAAYDSLARQLALEPDALDQLRRVISRRLEVSPRHRALGEITDALKTLLGLDAAYLLHWLTYMQPVRRLVQIQPDAPPEVHAFLSAAVSEHLPTFDLIQRTAQSSPEDWFDVDTRLVYNVTTQQFTIDLSLVKIDYTRVHLEMSPNSTLALVSQLLTAAADVRDAGAFREDIVRRWFEASLGLQRLFVPEDEEAAADDVGAPADSAPDTRA